VVTFSDQIGAKSGRGTSHVTQSLAAQKPTSPAYLSRRIVANFWYIWLFGGRAGTPGCWLSVVGVAGGSRVQGTFDAVRVRGGSAQQAALSEEVPFDTEYDEFTQLLLAARAGDEDAFAAIWRRFQPPLLRYMRVMAGGMAEDLTADTWMQVARKLFQFEGDEIAFRAWLYTIARNRHIDWRRQAAKRNESPVGLEFLSSQPGVDDPARAYETKMSTDSALALIATLPPDQSEAVMLRAIAGLPVAVAAEIMNKPPGTVRVLCHRGLRRLESILQGTVPREPGEHTRDEVV